MAYTGTDSSSSTVDVSDHGGTGDRAQRTASQSLVGNREKKKKNRN
jgi:hypothetical protein